MAHKWFEFPETDENLTIPLIDLVSEKMSWLLRDCGFRFVRSEYHPERFGDSLAILESSALRMRVERDRGQVLVSLGPLSEPETLWGLISLCEVIHARSVEPTYRLDDLAELLRSNFPALAVALGPELSETRQEIERRRAERLSRAGLRAKN
jgi:hypothetical protein